MPYRLADLPPGTTWTTSYGRQYEDDSPEPRPGWYRNTGATPLTVQPDGYPSAYLEPGEAAWLPDDPCHAHTEPCDAPADAGTETTE